MKKTSLCLLIACFFFAALSLAQEGTPKKEEKEKSKKEETKKEEKYEGTNIIVEQVVTASKRSEKRMETPSSIESISDDDLMKSSGTTYSSAMAQVKGLDFANGGINLQKISTRGFSSSFNSRMISLTDGTLSTLPGAGLPQGGLSAVSALDIKGLEVVLGPAGALYGSNTTAGVVNVITKDPWDQDGFSFDVRGGQQSLMDFQMRLAGVSSNGLWGYKLTAEYLDADEFESYNMFDAGGNNQTTLGFDPSTAMREWDIVSDHNVTSKKFELKGYYKSSFATFEASYSFSENDGFGVTNVGRNRIKGWEIQDYQFRASSDRWFFNVTHTKEDAGKTYSIQNVVGLLGVMDIEAAREAAKFIDLSSLTDMELQGNWSVNGLDIIAGASYRTYDPDSKGSYLDDIDAQGNHVDISRDELGLYLQLDYKAMDEKLRFVAAGRYDDFTEFDSEFSPKFGVTYNTGQHVFRANYMTSYRVPEIIESHIFYFGGLARGNLNGFDVYTNDGNLLAHYDALQPEDVTTFELGYRGFWGTNTAVDFVVYKSQYDNFISPLQLFAHAAYGTYAVWNTGEVIPVLFSYTNYGKADIEGADLGFDFYIGGDVTVKTSISYNKLTSFDNNTITIPDIPFNTPEWKYKASMNWDHFIVDKMFLNVSGRATDSYEYLSGRWSGTVEADPIFDMAVGYNIKDDSYFKLSWSNVTDQNETELLGTPAIPSYVTFEFFKKF